MLIVWKHNNVFVTRLKFAKFAFFRIYHRQHYLASSTYICKRCTGRTTRKDVFNLTFVMFDVCAFRVFCVFRTLSIRSNERRGKKLNRMGKKIRLVSRALLPHLNFDNWRYLFLYVYTKNSIIRSFTLLGSSCHSTI